MPRGIGPSLLFIVHLVFVCSGTKRVQQFSSLKLEWSDITRTRCIVFLILKKKELNSSHVNVDVCWQSWTTAFPLKRCLLLSSSEGRFSDDELLLLDDRWQQQRHKLLGYDVTRVDCPTLGFSPFFLLLRKLVATGQYIKKYIEECVYWGLLSRLHPCDGTDPFHVVVFFPWERESSRAAAAGGRCTARSPFTYCCRCLLSHASNISLSFSLWAKRFQIYTIWWISILIVLLHQPQKHTKLLLFFLSTSICLFDCRTNQIRTS